jgi:hypothetical protein
LAKRLDELVQHVERLVPVQRRRAWREHRDRPSVVLDESGIGKSGTPSA